MYTLDSDPGKIKALFSTWLQEQKKVDPKELDKDETRKAVLEREFRSLEVYRCYLKDEEGEPYSYDFTVETLGTMAVQKIVYQALMSVAELADKYTSLDRGDLPENVDIRPADARLTGYDFWFSGEDHTLGNLLQTWIDKNKVGTDGLTFVGYKVPHPLKEEMVLRVGVEDNKQETARLAIAEAAQGCADMFRTWAMQWLSASEDAGLAALGERRTVWQAHADAKGALPAAAATPKVQKSRPAKLPKANGAGK
jgi:DNA-directed RNA polymerase subunit L